MKRVSICAAWFLLGFLVLTGARTDRKMSAEVYQQTRFTTNMASAAGSTRVIGFKSSGAGTTSVRSDAETYYFWSFTNVGGETDTLWIFTPSLNGWAGKTDTTKSNALKVILLNGQNYEPEGLPIYGFNFSSGTDATPFLTVRARK